MTILALHSQLPADDSTADVGVVLSSPPKIAHTNEPGDGAPVTLRAADRKITKAVTGAENAARSQTNFWGDGPRMCG